MSHDLPSGCLFGSVLLNTLRDCKYTIYTFREEKYHFRPWDGQALSLSSTESETPRRPVAVENGRWLFP